MPNWKKVAVSDSAASFSSVTTPENVINNLTASTAVTASNIAPAISNDVDTRLLTAQGNGTLNGESLLTFDGTKLSVLYQAGDEGGELLLNKPVTNTSIAGTGVTIDIYQNKLRFFEQGGDARGYFIDITSGTAGVGTNLATGQVGDITGTVTRVNTTGSVNGITLTGGPITGNGTITLGGTLSNIQSTQLATSSIRIGATTFALGVTGSALAGMTSITSTGFTGSLLGTAATASYWSGSVVDTQNAAYAHTASYALYAVSASHEINYETSSSYAENATFATSASYWSGSIQHAQSASVAISASWAPYQTSASFALTASYWSGSITNATSASRAHTASYADASLTASYALTAGTAISLSSTASQALTSSYSHLAATASYWSGSIMNAQSSSYSITASYWSGSVRHVESASFANNSQIAQNAVFAYSVDTLRQPVTISGSVNISGSLLINGVAPGVGGGGATVTISGSAPSGSKDSGSLWWNNDDGNLYIQIVSPTGSTYVPAVNTVAGGMLGVTASFAETASLAVTASHAITSRTTTSASFSTTSSFATTASFSTTASWARSSSFTATSSFSATAALATRATAADTATSASTSTAITGTTGSGLWVWSMGNPTASGWTFSGDASFSGSAASGIILTPNDDFRNGAAYRNAPAGYFTTEEFILSANMISGGGNGADGIALFAGSNSVAGGNYQGITIFFDEYNGDGVSLDVLKIYRNNTLLAAIPVTNYIASGSVMDSNRVRKAEMVVEGPEAGRWLTVTLDDIIMYRANIGSWTPAGTLYGVWGFNGGLFNFHAVPAISLRTAKFWKMQQGLL
jgi:hypothetical protein